MLAFLTVPKIMVIIVKVAMTISQNLLQTAFSIYCKIKQSCQIEPSSRWKRVFLNKHFSLFFPLSFPDTTTYFQFLVSLLFVGFLFSRNIQVRNHFIALYCIILIRNLELHVLYGTWCTHTEKGNNATSRSISNKCRQPCIIVSSAPRQSTDHNGRMMLSSQIVLCLLSEIKHSHSHSHSHSSTPPESMNKPRCQCLACSFISIHGSIEVQFMKLW